MKHLLFAVMYSSLEHYSKALDILKKEFGDIKAEGEEYDFDFTAYYENEFGKNLKKRIVVFEKEIEKNELVGIRLKTGKIEEELAVDGKRVVNIDPGYISSQEVVLATLKGKPWKEELGKGVFGHKVIEFKDGEVITFRHTFADYKLGQNIEFFKGLL